MKEGLNIWGKEGCELPNGKLCNACCILSEIELEGNVASLKKSENSPCPNISEGGRGCRLHQTGEKPVNCQNWHCSQTPYHNKFDYIAQAIASGTVSDTEAIIAMLNLIGREGSKTHEALLIADIFLRADNLKRMTKENPLISGDIDEP